MKQRSSIFFPCVIVLALASVFLTGGASAASLPQRINRTCNSSAWNTVTSPNPGTSYNSLSGIAAVSSNNVWTVGDYRTSLDPQGPYFTLIEHWNGTTWSVVNSPSPGSMASVLTAAAFVPGTTNVWSAGYTQGTISQTLIVRHC